MNITQESEEQFEKQIKDSLFKSQHDYLITEYYKALVVKDDKEGIKTVKNILLTRLRSYQDLIYGDCSRDDRNVEDVLKAINIMRETFNIKEQRFGNNFNTTETGY